MRGSSRKQDQGRSLWSEWQGGPSSSVIYRQITEGQHKPGRGIRWVHPRSNQRAGVLGCSKLGVKRQEVRVAGWVEARPWGGFQAPASGWVFFKCEGKPLSGFQQECDLKKSLWLLCGEQMSWATGEGGGPLGGCSVVWARNGSDRPAGCGEKQVDTETFWR